MFQFLRSILLVFYGVDFFMRLIVILIGGPIALIWMIMLIAAGEYSEAANVFLLVAVMFTVIGFIAWVRHDAKDFGRKIDERRRRRALRVEAKTTSPIGHLEPPVSSSFRGLKYEVKEIPLPDPPPTGPNPD